MAGEHVTIISVTSSSYHLQEPPRSLGQAAFSSLFIATNYYLVEINQKNYILSFCVRVSVSERGSIFTAGEWISDNAMVRLRSLKDIFFKGVEEISRRRIIRECS